MRALFSNAILPPKNRRKFGTGLAPFYRMRKADRIVMRETGSFRGAAEWFRHIRPGFGGQAGALELNGGVADLKFVR